MRINFSAKKSRRIYRAEIIWYTERETIFHFAQRVMPRAIIYTLRRFSEYEIRRVFALEMEQWQIENKITLWLKRSRYFVPFIEIDSNDSLALPSSSLF